MSPLALTIQRSHASGEVIEKPINWENLDATTTSEKLHLFKAFVREHSSQRFMGYAAKESEEAMKAIVKFDNVGPRSLLKTLLWDLRNVSDQLRLSILRSLVESGVDLSMDFGDRALSLAVRHGDRDLVQEMVAKGGLSKGALVYGLHTAVSANNLELAKFLIQNGAEVTRRPSGFREYEMVEAATRRQNVDLVRLLLESGADKEQ